ncbi:MAG: efflux RND transporter periplasmic adaptor subunit [Planctomycetaceae bacterium]
MRKPTLLLLLALAALLFGAWRYSATRPLETELAVVARGTARSMVEEEGRTRVAERYLVAAPVAGRILRIERREGDAVARGDLLAEVDPLALRARVGETEARLRAVREQEAAVPERRPKPVELERARVLAERAAVAAEAAAREAAEALLLAEQAARDAARARALREEGTIGAEEMEKAGTAAEQALLRGQAQEAMRQVAALDARAAELEAALLAVRSGDFAHEEQRLREEAAALEAELVVRRDELGRARVLAPVAGAVLRRFHESERTVPAGEPLFEIGDPARLEVEADLLSEDVALLREGMAVEVFGRALGERIVRGRLARIHPAAFTKVSSLGVEQQRVTVVVAVEGQELRLGDRFRVDVRILLDERPGALLVPEEALFRHEGAWNVFRIEGDHARLARVETGIRSGRHREVLSGLQEGDRVMLHPPPELEEGARIRPRREP